MKRLWKQLGQLSGIALALNLVIELVSRKSLTGLFSYMTGSPAVFLLNGALLLAPFLPVFFVRRRIFFTAAVGFVLLLSGVANGVLLVFRTTPFTAADLKLVKYAANMVTLYLSWPQLIGGAAALVAAFALGVVLWRKAPVEPLPISFTESACVAAVGMAVIWGGLNAAILTETVAVRFGNIGQAYQDYGFAYCFANSAFNTGIAKPDSYDVETVTEIEEELPDPEMGYGGGKQREPNIIMIQLESFFDPFLWKGYQGSEDPIPFFRFLKRAYPSGYLSVPSVGAGTANTEFECITGMNLDFFGPGEYPYKTVLQTTACESLAFDLKEIGYRAHAVHNNEATFYDRHKVFAQLGFDSFTPIEYMYDSRKNPAGWPEDRILTEEIKKALDDDVEPDFIYGITVQSHGKYPSFEYYTQQLRAVDDFIRDLTVSLTQRKEPTVLVLYGDHLPGFEWSAEEMENGSLFQTEYVIWNNIGLPYGKKDLEAYQLGAYVLELLDIHEGTMPRFHQKYLDENAFYDPAEYLDAMKILEYDMLYGDHQIYQGESPYTTTKMEMGILPIIQRTTLHVGEQINVFGENFNEYSKICVNGKPAETELVHKKWLIARGVPYEAGEEITVQQIGRDKVALGTAKKGPGA